MKAGKDQRIHKIRQARKETDPGSFINDLLAGDIKTLSKAITLTESNAESDRRAAGILLNQIIPYTGKSLRIGVTGLPGAGKSTLIEALGCMLVKRGKKVAVLAVDPSSEAGKGSILGDKTRMPLLSASASAFIRPSPSSGVLGGVTAHTREAILLCEAAGFEVILVETVGVGQSETEVHGMTDLFLLLLIAGGGDELQGIKRGIMELADIVVVNKADGQNLQRASATRQEINRALHFLPLHSSGWMPRALACSAFNPADIAQLWEAVESYMQLIMSNGYFEKNRKTQQLEWFHEQIRQEIIGRFYADKNRENSIHSLEASIRDGKLSVRDALDKLFTGN